MILQSLTGLPAFLAYFCTAFVIVIVYFVVRIPIPTCRSALRLASLRRRSGSDWLRLRPAPSARHRFLIEPGLLLSQVLVMAGQTGVCR